MAGKPKILAFAGSARKDSWNKRILALAVQGAKAAGADVTVLDFRDLVLPLFDQDEEAKNGLHPNARKLKDLMIAHHGFLIACPEYNSSITPLLKNAIDWASRPVANETPLNCYHGKVAALMSASEGAFGGLRGLVHVRAILGNIRTLVLPDQVAVPRVNTLFGPDGAVTNPAVQKSLEQLGADVAAIVTKLSL